MTKSAADVEREVEASRGRLDATVEALKDKMSPGQLFDEASHAMGGAGQQLLDKLIEAAKANPLPVAVVGIGLAWLMTSSGKSDDSATAAPSMSGHDGMLGGVKDAVSDKVSSAKDAVGDTMASAKDAVGGAVHGLSDKAGSLTQKASGFGRTSLQGVADLMDREPMLLGALGVVLGVGLASALPSTTFEDKTIGPAHDGLVEKGKALAHDGLDKAEETAQSAFGAAKEEVRKALAETGATQGA